MKVSIADLDEILNGHEKLDIEILPDGSIHTVPAGTAKNSTPQVLSLAALSGPTNY